MAGLYLPRLSLSRLTLPRQILGGSGEAKDFATHLGTRSGEIQVIEISLRHVRPGMTILQDVRTELGMLLIARGFEVTERFAERSRNFGPGLLAEKVPVSVPLRRAASGGD